MSNYLNNDNETTLLFKKFQGVAQTQVLTSDTGALSYTGEPKKSLTNVFQENIFSENVPTDLSFTLLEIYNGVAFGSIPEGDFSNNVNNQTIVTRDLSAGVFGVDLPLTYYNKLYLAPTNGTNQAWWFIDPGSTTSTNNNILKNMIPYLYNDVNPNTYTPIVEYYNVTTSTWVSEAQASGNGLNWSIDPASGILQFYQSNSILTSSPYQLNGITGGADISQNRPRISFIKYTGTFGSGTGGGGGGGSGLINVGKIDVSNNNVLSSHDVSGIYFDASGFDVSLNAGNTVTTGSNLTIIGHNAQASSATATNEITLGDANVTVLRMGNGVKIIDGGALVGGAVDLTAVSTNIIPDTNDSLDLGSASFVWRNIYTGDLHLSNEAKSEGNSVDGTKGSWTIQEGSEDLFIVNNKSGKKYKFKLEEI